MNHQEIDWKESEKMIGYIVGRIAKRLPSHIDTDDLKSVGVIGLMDAANKFDDSRGIKFSTYAEHRIKGAILDELRSMDWVSRSTRQKTRKLERAYAEVEQTLGHAANGEYVADFLDMAADEFHALEKQATAISTVSLDGAAPEMQKGYHPPQLGDIVADHKAEDQLAALSQGRTAGRIAEAIGTLPERERMVVTLYYYEDLSLKEIGGILGVVESRVCQIHSKAKASLQAKLTS